VHVVENLVFYLLCVICHNVMRIQNLNYAPQNALEDNMMFNKSCLYS
jgi:hypothetical protein